MSYNTSSTLKKAVTAPLPVYTHLRNAFATIEFANTDSRRTAYVSTSEANIKKIDNKYKNAKIINLITTKTNYLPVLDIMPRTELGRMLIELRRKKLASGEKLLSADEINSNIAKERKRFS